MNWKDELKKIIESGCSDSNIEDFVYEHPEVEAKDIWDYVYEYNAPYECKRVEVYTNVWNDALYKMCTENQGKGLL